MFKDIVTANFQQAMKLIPVIHRKTPGLTPLLLGDTGIGKTEMVKQYCKDRDLDLIIIHVSHLEPSDFVGLYQIKDGKTHNCHPDWLPDTKMQMEITEINLKGEKIGDNKRGGVIFLDEITRGQEDIRQATCQFLQEKKLHTYSLPSNYNLIAAGNGDGYETYEYDDAQKGRFFPINYCPTVEEVLNYLESKYPHHVMLNWIRSDGELIDFKPNGLGTVLLTPRNLENAARLWEDGEKEDLIFQRLLLAGVMPPTKVTFFLAYLEELRHINIKDIILGDNMEKLDQLFKDSRKDVLSTLSRDLAIFLDKEVGDVEKTKHPLFKNRQEAIVNIANFVYRLPADSIGAFIDYFQGDAFKSRGTILHNQEFMKIVKPKTIGLASALKEIMPKEEAKRV